MRRIAICGVTLEGVEDRDACLFPKMIALPGKSHGFAHFPQIQPTCFLRARLGEYRVKFRSDSERSFCLVRELKLFEQVSHQRVLAQKPMFAQ